MKSMKKWWVEFKVGDLEFSGFFNTQNHDNVYPEKVTGTFWTKNDGKKKGFAYLDSGELEYIFMSCTKEGCVTVGSEVFLYPTEVESWDFVSMKIEDCLNLEKTYIHYYD